MSLIMFILFIGIFNKCSNENLDIDIPMKSESISPAGETLLIQEQIGCSNLSSLCCCNYTVCFPSNDVLSCSRKNIFGEDQSTCPLNQMISIENENFNPDGSSNVVTPSPQTSDEKHVLGSCSQCNVCPVQQICCPSGNCCLGRCNPRDGCAT